MKLQRGVGITAAHIQTTEKQRKKGKKKRVILDFFPEKKKEKTKILEISLFTQNSLNVKFSSCVCVTKQTRNRDKRKEKNEE